MTELPTLVLLLPPMAILHADSVVTRMIGQEAISAFQTHFGKIKLENRFQPIDSDDDVISCNTSEHAKTRLDGRSLHANLTR